MASRLANKILFKGCVSPEGEQRARELRDSVRDSDILVNADESVSRFFELDADGPEPWEPGADLPHVGPPSSVERVFVECRMPPELPAGWDDAFRPFGIDAWGVAFHYQDLMGYYLCNTDGVDPRRNAHSHAHEALASYLSGRSGPQGQPSASLLPYDGPHPAARWLLQSELFLSLSSAKTVLAGAFGMDGVVCEDGGFAGLRDGGRAIYYRTTPQAFEPDLGATSSRVAAAAAAGTAALYVPLLATLCLTHHEASPPLSPLPGVAPCSGKGPARGGISVSNSWRTFDTSRVERALESEGALHRDGLRSALGVCGHRFRSHHALKENAAP